jgi:primosomal protein N' (replication factor Y)
LINSTVSEAKKTKIWLDIFSGKSKIIVWTRSALFYPYINLWTIIVDEEHDNSYFSDKNPRYSWIEVALEIGKILDIKVILASWTPKINDMYNAIKWKFELISLMEKYNK